MLEQAALDQLCAAWPGAPPVDPKTIREYFGQCRDLEIRRVDSASVAAIRFGYSTDGPSSGLWYSDHVHYLNMSLIPRSSGALGCFSDFSDDYQRLGPIMFVPARHLLRGRSQFACRERSINLYVRGDDGFEDEHDFRNTPAGLLPDCLRLQSAAITDIVARIGREISQPGFATNLMVEGLGLMLLAEIGRTLRTIETRPMRRGGLAPWRLKLIEERVAAGDHLPSLTELATLCGLSRRQLLRAYRTETGQTIGAFIQQVSMKRACALLLTSDQPIGSVAAQIGFANAAAFSTAFRRATGLTPRCFRANRGSL